jgi:tetratricopeptide (TPR) repeat protein
VHYCELAADRAVAVYAYRDAERLLEQALDVQEVLDPDDTTKRCDLTVALGEVLYPADEPRRVLDELAPRALALAEALGDRERASRACQLAIAGIHTYGGADAWSTPEAARWTELAARFAAKGSADQVWVEHAATCVSIARGDPGAARAAAARARQVADSLGDPVLQWIADDTWLYVACLYVSTPELAAEAVALAEDLAARSHPGVSAHMISQAMLIVTWIFLQAGLREQALASTRQIEALAERTKKPQEQLWALAVAAWIPIAEGRLEEVIVADEHIRAQGEETGLAALALFASSTFCLYAYLYLGRVDPLELPRHIRFWVPDFAEMTEHETARDLLDRLSDSPLGDDPAAGVLIPRFAVLVELALLTKDSHVARILFDYLRSTSPITFFLRGAIVPVARQLGDLAALLGERDEARAHYEHAFEVCERMRLRPEKALTALGLAELLLAGNDAEQAEAQPHLDFAIAELQEMKMQPALKRALAHKGLLKA